MIRALWHWARWHNVTAFCGYVRCWTCREWMSDRPFKWWRGAERR